MMRFLAQDACNEPSNATYKHGLDGETSELIEVWPSFSSSFNLPPSIVNRRYAKTGSGQAQKENSSKLAFRTGGV